MAPRSPNPVPLCKRPPKERHEAYRILHGRRHGPLPLYDPDYHPDALIQFFQEHLEGIAEIESRVTKNRERKYTQKPIPPPTLSGWAHKMGIARQTVWEWEQKHSEFGQAVGLAKAIQEDTLIRMGVLGAYNPRLVELMLKNLHEWTDRAEVTTKGEVHLHFDAQDEKCL